MNTKVILVLFALTILKKSVAENTNLGYRLLIKIYDECDKSEDMIKCFKIQALKFANRALQSKSFKIMDGLQIVQDETARSLFTSTISDENMDKLESDQIDKLLTETTEKFVETHKIKLYLPKLIEEGRGKFRKGMGPLLAAMAIKGGMMMMTMKGVAVMAGMALVMGKMAFMLSSIIGIKKLMESKGGEKTTVEIVKHPSYSYGNSYSSSYEDAGHYGGGGGGHSGGGGGGGYHRSLDASESSPQKRVHAYVRNKIR